VNDQELEVIARATQRAVERVERRAREEVSIAVREHKSAPTASSDPVDMMIDAVSGLIQRSIAPLAARIAELEGRRTMGFAGALKRVGPRPALARCWNRQWR
jgi:hypothetical protein